MQAVIYAGLRNGARDQQIHDALIYKHVVEVAEEFKLSPNTVRAAAKRIEKAVVFDLKLLGGGSQCRSGRSQQTASEKQPWARTAAITVPSATLNCPAG
ncbi:hypothetical protein [Pseudomonas sp. GM49]|uniref:hypothetical protein n=1 Tax=Pseudomonas sp. GM49 TaxID=1144331 RepID=UPI0012FA1DD6|nr:hypothetical protein [Pseudomonas sp. GM49]